MRYLMSMDGGGSKLACIIADETGNLVGKGYGGPTSGLTTKGQSNDSVYSAISQALSQSGIPKEDICMIYSSILAYNHSEIYEIIQNLTYTEIPVKKYDEANFSLFGAIQEEIGGVVQSGTGSFACVKTGVKREVKKGEWGGFGREYIGGHGPIISDEGSGFYIGRKGLIACLHMIDGRGPFTLLKDEIAAAWELKDWRFSLQSKLEDTSQGGWRTTIAALCPVIGRCADKGDAVAIGILGKAAYELSKMIVTLIKRYDVCDEFPITVSGGAWRTSPVLFNSFSNAVKKELPNANVIPPLFDPVVGGVLLGLRDMGFPVKEKIEELKSKYALYAYTIIA